MARFCWGLLFTLISVRKAALFAETGLYRDALAPLRATARQHRLPALGLHPRTEAVLFYPLAAVGLECTFRHGNSRTPDWQNGIKTNSEYKGRKLIPAINRCYSRGGKENYKFISRGSRRWLQIKRLGSRPVLRIRADPCSSAVRNYFPPRSVPPR